MPAKTVEDLQNTVFNRILSPMVLQNMYQMEAVGGANYAVIDYLSDLENVVFKNNDDIYSRNLQRNFVSSLSKLVDNRNNDQTDITAFVRGRLSDLKSRLASKLNAGDQSSKYHYQDLIFRIEKTLDPKS